MLRQYFLSIAESLWYLCHMHRGLLTRCYPPNPPYSPIETRGTSARQRLNLENEILVSSIVLSRNSVTVNGIFLKPSNLFPPGFPLPDSKNPSSIPHVTRDRVTQNWEPKRWVRISPSHFPPTIVMVMLIVEQYRAFHETWEISSASTTLSKFRVTATCPTSTSGSLKTPKINVWRNEVTKMPPQQRNTWNIMTADEPHKKTKKK